MSYKQSFLASYYQVMPVGVTKSACKVTVNYAMSIYWHHPATKTKLWTERHHHIAGTSLNLWFGTLFAKKTSLDSFLASNKNTESILLYYSMISATLYSRIFLADDLGHLLVSSLQFFFFQAMISHKHLFSLHLPYREMQHDHPALASFLYFIEISLWVVCVASICSEM